MISYASSHMLWNKQQWKRPQQLLMLLIEVPILIITLGLMAWALSILSKSIGYATNVESRRYGLIPPAYLQNATLTQTVTGYRTTSIRPPITFTHQTSTSTFAVGFKGSSATQTYLPTTRTFLPATFGIDATATTLRTVTQSALQPISHLVIIEEKAAILSPLPTPAPVLKRQQDSSPVRLAATDFWSVDSTVLDYEQYASVTVNHGFGRYFLEAGIDYIFQDPQGYSTGDLARIQALTALVSLALVSIVGRITCTLVYLLYLSRREGSQPDKRVRRLTLANMTLTIVLFMTYIPFWAVYGAWTNRNDTVKAADAVFRKEDSYFGLNDLLQSTPWQGTTTAFITFWTLSIITSSLLTLMRLLNDRKRHWQEQDL